MRRVVFSLGLLLAGLSTGAIAEERLSLYRVSPAESVMRQLGERFEVIRKLENGYEIVVPESKLQELYAIHPAARLSELDMHAQLKALPPGDLYDVGSMERRLREFAQRYPNLVKLETYGTSRQGRPEYVLTMAKDVQSPDLTKPGLMITSATHGDEVITVEVSLGLIDRLLAGYASDERLRKMVDDHVIYWIPAACVDGYANRSRYVDGRDPNRDFAWPENPTRQPATGCTKDIVQFFHAHENIVGTMDIHAAGSMIMFPWAYTYSHIPDADYMAQDQLTERMAEENGFAHGPISEVIYVAKGSSADYYYWKRQTVSVAIEVSRNFAPGREEVTDIITENMESTWRFIEHFQAQ